MWGETWGSMIWGGAAELVPALSPMGLGVLAVALLGLGVAVRSARRRVGR